MNHFEEASLRLKQQIGVLQDKDLAEVLGFKSAAWVKRKARNAFPDAELYALAAKRPDLKIDVLYILTGISAYGQAEMALSARASKLLPEEATTFDEIKAHSIATQNAMRDAQQAAGKPAPLPNDQQMWLDCYLGWGPAMQRRELARALGLTDTVPEVTPDKGPGAGQIGGTYSQHASGDGSIQIGRMTRQPTPTPTKRKR